MTYTIKKGATTNVIIDNMNIEIILSNLNSDNVVLNITIDSTDSFLHTVYLNSSITVLNTTITLIEINFDSATIKVEKEI